MKTTLDLSFAGILCAIFLAGCSTPSPKTTVAMPPLPLVVTKAKTGAGVTAPSVHKVYVVSWNCLCEYTNEITGLKATSDLTIPLPQWPVVYETGVATTNWCYVTNTGGQMFFSAFNTLTNS